MPTVGQDVSGDSALQTAIAALKAKIEGAEESSYIDQAVSQINTALGNKQDKLTFDSTPTAGSSNPVTSGGVKTALDRKQDTLIFDSEPTAESTKPVTSGGVKAAMDEQYHELNDRLVAAEEAIDICASGIYDTASGSIVSITDGADDMPMKSCVVNIEPIQEGEGDPSPENVRPISGRTGLSVTRTGKNLIPSYTTSGNESDITWTVGQDGTVVVNGTASKTVIINAPFSSWEWDGIAQCWVSGCPDGGSDTTYALRIGGSHATQFSIACYDSVGCLLRRGGPTPFLNEPIRFQIIIRSGIACNNLTFTPQLEYGSAKSNYEPYKGSTVSVNWETEAGTVYGGYVDVVSGKLTVDRAYIASYNGETLPSTWISDRDVYSAGTTPTTGAQVVYKLAEPVEYQLTSQEVRTLLGENNIWSDAGDVTAEYPADTKMYIDTKIAEAVAAAMV